VLKRPIGVTVVAALTLTMALVLFYLQLVLLALTAIGGPPPSGTGYSLPLTFFIPSFLAVFAFSVSIGQLLGTKWSWYASIAFWIIFIAYFGWYAYVLNLSYRLIRLDLYPYPDVLYVFAGLLLSLSPLIYGGCCLTYFLRKSTRTYFHV
jgi:hypothetical protein